MSFVTWLRKGTHFSGEEHHIYAFGGLIDGSYFEGTPWVLSNAWLFRANRVPAGRIPAVDGGFVYGYGDYHFTSEEDGRPRHKYCLFRTTHLPETKDKKRPWFPQDQTFQCGWKVEVPLYVRGMVKTGDTLAVAAAPYPLTEKGECAAGLSPQERVEYFDKARQLRKAWEGEMGAHLRPVSASDGSPISGHPLPAPPVFDGMSAAGGRLIISMTNGEIGCIGPAGAVQ